MNKLLKRLVATTIAVVTIVASVPLNTFAAYNETNIQHNAYGGEFKFVYDSGFTDYNAPDVGYGVKQGNSSASSGYQMSADPTPTPLIPGAKFTGWIAKGIYPDPNNPNQDIFTNLLTADGKTLWTTQQTLDYVVDGTYTHVFFDAQWEDANGNPVSGYKYNNIGMQFDVWDGTAEFGYQGTSEKLSAARFYVKGGECAGDYGTVSDIKNLSGSSCIVFDGWQLEIHDNGTCVYVHNKLLTTAEALAYKANANYAECQYIFTAKWEEQHTDNVTNGTSITLPDGVCDICNNNMPCPHNGFKWYSTEEQQHVLHCGDCGDPVEPAYSHVDNEGPNGNTPDGRCDVCRVGLNSNNEHIHTWDYTQWFFNNDYSEHFRNCTDSDCTTSTDAGMHIDQVGPGSSVPDGKCDICDFCTQHGAVTWTEVGKNHHSIMCVCGYMVGNPEEHYDQNGDYICDGCNAPFDIENGKPVHHHTVKPGNWSAGTYEHFYECDTCGGTVFNSEKHKDDNNDYKCDVCKASVDANLVHNCSDYPHGYKAEDEEIHIYTCLDCGRKYGMITDHHKDTNGDSKCDDCSATLDANDLHIHQPDGNWYDDGASHSCECTECEGWVYEKHIDQNEDGTCEGCNLKIDTFSGGMNLAQLAKVTSDLNAAVDKAFAGDTSDLKKLIDAGFADRFVYFYNDAKSNDPAAYVSANDNVIYVTEAMANAAVKQEPELKDMVDWAKTSIGSKETFDRLVGFDLTADIYEYNEIKIGCSLEKVLNSQEFEFTLNFNVNDVKEDRVWHVYVIDTNDGTITKVKTTGKGDKTVDVTSSNFFNEIYVLTYEDVASPVILEEPESVTQNIGQKFAITVKAQGEGLKYQWYYKDAGMKDFKTSSNKSSSYAYAMQSYMHNRQVYCVITDAYGEQLTTKTATIKRPPMDLKLLDQPKDVCVVLGEKFSISAKAEGDGVTYQWYYKESYMKDFKISSNKTSAYAYAMQSYMHNRQVYCVITDERGNQVITDVATIIRPPMNLKLLDQPKDVYAVKGEKFSISAKAEGDGVTYQWYYKESYMKDFKASSNKTSAYAYAMQGYMNNRSVYCVITDQYGNQVQTTPVTIYLK